MQQESPLESIPEMKLFVDVEKQKGTDQSPLVGSYVFQKCCHVKNHGIIKFEGLYHIHMAGSSQSQHFFAAGCIFADFSIAVIFYPAIKTL